MSDYIIEVVAPLLPGEPRTWVREMNFEYQNGRGQLLETRDASEAKRFKSNGDAMQFWKTQSTRRPLRPDGEPNRPLTAYTVSIEVGP